MRKRNKTSYLIGEKYENVLGEIFEIIGYDEEDSQKRKIRFEDGFENDVYISQIKKKTPRSMNHKTYFGVGYLGGKNLTLHPLFHRWYHMLSRCYNIKSCNYRSYGAKGVTVSDELLCFKNFIDILSTKENYKQLIDNPSQWQIDKDINGGKIYSPETILIVPSEINLLVENNAKKIKVTQINNNGKIVDTYESINEAEKITHLPRGNIARAVREGIKCGGYYWRRVDE